MGKGETMKRKGFYSGILFLVLLFGFSVAETAQAQRVRIGGTGFGLGVMKILGAVFEKSHPEVKIEVIPSLGSSGGIRALLHGALNIAVSGRPLVGKESGKGADAKELVKSPFFFIANKSVTKEGLTLQELEKIYRGETLTWPDGKRIRLVLRPETDTVTKMVRELSPGMSQAVNVAMSREGMIHAITDQESANIVEKIPGTLAASTLIQVYSEKRQVRILSFNGIDPGVKSLSDGTYPLSLSLYLVTPSKMPQTVQKFLDFIYSDKGVRILTKNGNMVVRNSKSGG